MVKLLAIFFASALGLSMSNAQADPAADKVTLAVSQSRTITLERPAKRVSIANPELADVIVLSPTEYYLLARDVGVTNLLVWDRETGNRSSIEVEVTHDLEGLKSRLFRLIPNQSIEVTPAQRSIVLSGTVPDATAMTTALKVAESYLTRAGGARRQAAGGTESGGEIINLLQVAGSQQVMVEVRVAEVARSELKRMNARFNAFGIRGNWSGGGVNGGALFPDARFSSSQLRIPSINSDGSSVVAPVLDEFARAFGRPDQRPSRHFRQ
ncbi:MAG: hypothetical protein EBV29_06505 [Gammaproteobacteria bacterium]|nr:hypothetical protein [Gammaproteobacteria bacterium]